MAARVESPLTVSPRAWQIEHVNVSRTQGETARGIHWRSANPKSPGSPPRGPCESPVAGWRQTFIWPVKGRISGRFGSQRIYKGGEAGSYHSGIDIATGESGTPIVAPADGVVVLAAEQPFTLEGIC